MYFYIWLLQIGEWRPTSPADPSRIQYLDLSMASIDVPSLNHLLERCPLLKKLSLESVPLEDSTCEIIGEYTLPREEFWWVTRSGYVDLIFLSILR